MVEGKLAAYACWPFGWTGFGLGALDFSASSCPRQTYSGDLEVCYGMPMSNRRRVHSSHFPLGKRHRR
jgi:hypothetical protein